MQYFIVYPFGSDAREATDLLNSVLESVCQKHHGDELWMQDMSNAIVVEASFDIIRDVLAALSARGISDLQAYACNTQWVTHLTTTATEHAKLCDVRTTLHYDVKLSYRFGHTLVIGSHRNILTFLHSNSLDFLVQQDDLKQADSTLSIVI